MDFSNNKEVIDGILLYRRNVFKKIPVPPELEHVIQSITIDSYKNEDITSLISRPFPHGSVTVYIGISKSLVIYDSDFKRIKLSTEYLVGIHKLERLHYVCPSCFEERIIIKFKPGGFFKLFGLPACLMMNQIVDLKSCIPPGLHNVVTRIYHYDNTDDRVKFTLNFFNDLALKHGHDKRIHSAGVIHLIGNSNGDISVTDICCKLNLSIRSIQRNFQNEIGISPKEYIRIIRFNKVFEYLLNSKFSNWHEVVYSFGYYDQAHFIHDFKLVTAYTPTEFLSHKQEIMIFLDRYYLIYHTTDLERMKGINFN